MSDTTDPNSPAFDPCAGNVDCERALAGIYSFLDGELTLEKRTIIRTHLEVCSPCGDRYSFESELRQVVSMRCREKVPEELRNRIAAALLREVEGP